MGKQPDPSSARQLTKGLTVGPRFGIGKPCALEGNSHAAISSAVDRGTLSVINTRREFGYTPSDARESKTTESALNIMCSKFQKPALPGLAIRADHSPRRPTKPRKRRRTRNSKSC